MKKQNWFLSVKLYQAQIKEEGFLEQFVIDDIYPEKDFHTMYTGEIIEILIKDKDSK